MKAPVLYLMACSLVMPILLFSMKNNSPQKPWVSLREQCLIVIQQHSVKKLTYDQEMILKDVLALDFAQKKDVDYYINSLERFNLGKHIDQHTIKQITSSHRTWGVDPKIKYFEILSRLIQ